jgi:hypothetical protein
MWILPIQNPRNGNSEQWMEQWIAAAAISGTDEKQMGSRHLRTGG